MPQFDSLQVTRPGLAVLASLIVLSFSACDHAKDLVEQGKKQAEDIQKSIEAKTETAASPNASGTSTEGSAAATSPSVPPTAQPTPQPTPPAADPNLLVDKFLKGEAENKTDGMLHALGALAEEYRARITTCDLSESKITDDGLAEVAKFPKLALLNLSGCNSITSNGLGVLKDLQVLETLLLDRGIVGDANVNVVRVLSNLKVLSLNQTSITDAGIAQLNSLTHLEELHVSSTPVDGSCFLKAPWMASLRVLMANNTSVGQNINVMKKFHNLEELGLYKAQVTDQTVAPLKGSPKLRKLYLGDNRLSDAGAKQLSGLAIIEVLSLAKNSVTDNCLPTFKVCKKLTYFGEGETAITAAGRAYLLKIAPDCSFDTK